MHGIYVFPLHGGIDTEVSQASSMATWHHFLCTRFGRQNHQTDLKHDHHGASYQYVCSVFLEWLDGWPVSLIIQDHQGCQRDWIGDCCLPGKFRQPNKILWTSGTSSSLLSVCHHYYPHSGYSVEPLSSGFFCLNRRHLWRKDGGLEKAKRKL